MIDNIKYATAITEVLYYLKGIRQEDINKIPKKLIDFFNENTLNSYKCNFDYTKPLNELDLSEEAKGLIAMICLNYWCETEEKKKMFINQLNKNEIVYQEELKKQYDIENIFKNRKLIDEVKAEKQFGMVEYKRTIFQKIWGKIKKIFYK